MSTISQALLAHLKTNGADFFASVPCKLLGGLLISLEEDKSITHVSVTREEEGLGVCAGAYFGGKTPVLVMQNTGVGTLLTSLCSLGLHFNLPITMIISHRGSPGEKISAQVPMSIAAQPLLEQIGIPTFAFSDSAQVAQVGQLVEHANVAQRPVAALLDFNFWQ